MSRSNETTKGAFTVLIGNRSDKPEYENFISNGITNNTERLTKLETKYVTLLSKITPTIKKLSELEVTIMQVRCKENFLPNVKLSRLKNYIYARCPFYRNQTVGNDIRIIAGTTDKWGEDMNVLLKNKKFMTIVKNKLSEAMETEIQKTFPKL